MSLMDTLKNLGETAKKVLTKAAETGKTIAGAVADKTKDLRNKVMDKAESTKCCRKGAGETAEVKISEAADAVKEEAKKCCKPHPTDHLAKEDADRVVTPKPLGEADPQ